MILQQEIAPEQVRKLLDEGKTDLLEGFVSSRTNRKFKAFLAKQANGKIGFEFEARASDKGGAAKKAATKKTAVTKTASKKTAAKKTAAKKTAAKKTAAKTTNRATDANDDAPF